MNSGWKRNYCNAHCSEGKNEHPGSGGCTACRFSGDLHMAMDVQATTTATDGTERVALHRSDNRVAAKLQHDA